MNERAYLDAFGRWRSEGRRAFDAIAKATSQFELARILHVSSKTICAIATGARRPSIDLAGEIDRKLGIGASTWSIAPRVSPLRVDATRCKVLEDDAGETGAKATPRTDAA